MPLFLRNVTDERDGLLALLGHLRHALINTSYGLTEDQARETPSASSLSVGGLIKHVDHSERTWIDTAQQTDSGSQESYFANFALTPDETLAGVCDHYLATGRATDEIVAGLDLDQFVPKPGDAPWLPDDVDGWTVRWILLHLIHETARHCGHADIVRESVDGATSYPLLMAVEGIPGNEWMQPWQPSGS